MDEPDNAADPLRHAARLRITLSRSQREMLALLRDPRSIRPGASPMRGVAEASESLRACCREHRLIPAEAPPIAAAGECLVLAALASLQRPRREVLKVDPCLLEALTATAAAVAAIGIRLPLSPALLALLEQHGWAAPVANLMPPENRPIRSIAPLRKGTLRERAAWIVGLRGIVTTAEFGRMGISRQYLSMMCLQGLFRRTGFGKYEMAVPDTRFAPKGGDDVRPEQDRSGHIPLDHSAISVYANDPQ